MIIFPLKTNKQTKTKPKNELVNSENRLVVGKRKAKQVTGIKKYKFSVLK